MGLSSCFEGMVDEAVPLPHTTFNARTYLQPQLNKAIKLSERESSPLTDRNPKDFILFKTGEFQAVALSSDNDGAGSFDAAAPFPTLTFPSDHAVLGTTLEPVFVAGPTTAGAEAAAIEVAAGAEAAEGEPRPEPTEADQVRRWVGLAAAVAITVTAVAVVARRR